MAKGFAERTEVGLQSLDLRVLVEKAFYLGEKRHDGTAAVLAELASDQIERLNPVGALVDHGDARVAHELLHAGFPDVAVAPEHLLRHYRIGKASIGEYAFDDRRHQAHVIVCVSPRRVVLGAMDDVVL